VLTNYQNQDIGRQLLTACQGFFSENKATLEGVSTYPNSPKHITMYQKFGYKPKGLVVIAAKPMDRREIVQATRPPRAGLEVRRYSSLEEARKKAAMLRVRRITNGIWRGMDLGKEVEIVDGLALGDTLVLEKDGGVLGFAICHTPGVSEAPQASLYVKYLAIDPARRRPEHFVQLLGACEELGVNAACQHVIAPVYTGYWRAYQTMLASGYHVDMLMLRMKRGKHDDYEREEDFVLDDWR
jgi:ribosomal protein S18 acetylase RimI-like enzyme